MTIAAVSRSARDLQKLQYSLFGNQSQTAAGIAVPITSKPGVSPLTKPCLAGLSLARAVQIEYGEKIFCHLDGTATSTARPLARAAE